MRAENGKNQRFLCFIMLFFRFICVSSVSLWRILKSNAIALSLEKRGCAIKKGRIFRPLRSRETFTGITPGRSGQHS